MKNIANADRPKSAMAILPLRPCRGSGKAAQTAFKSARRDGKSLIPMVNHFSSDLGILKIRLAATFRIAEPACPGVPISNMLGRGESAVPLRAVEYDVPEDVPRRGRR